MKSSNEKVVASDPVEEIQNEVRKNIKRLFLVTKRELAEISFRLPPPHVDADYSFSTFSLGQHLKQNPTSVAKIMAKDFSTNSALIKKIHATGPFVNIVVDKEAFNEKAIAYFVKGKLKHVTRSVANVLVSTFSPNGASAFEESRLALLGTVIGRCYSLSGKKVSRLDYLYATGKLYSSFVKDVIRNGLKSRIAEPISGTRVVITSANFKLTPVALRRYDGSFTSATLYLAYIRSMAKQKPTKIVFLCSQGDMDVLDTTLVLARQMKLLPLHTKLSIVAVPTSNITNSFSTKKPEFIYAMLRTPFHQKFDLKFKKTNEYSLVNAELGKLKQSLGKQSLHPEDVFKATMLLIDFTKTVDQVALHHNPSVICTYLERLAQLSKSLHINRDMYLARATSIVLQKGFKILFS